jgi:hypothetical protein
MFKCETCGLAFAREVLLKAHFHPTKCECCPGMPCAYCKRNIQPKAIPEYVKFPDVPKQNTSKFICDDCGISFSKEIQLKAHFHLIKCECCPGMPCAYCKKMNRDKYHAGFDDEHLTKN